MTPRPRWDTPPDVPAQGWTDAVPARDGLFAISDGREAFWAALSLFCTGTFVGAGLMFAVLAVHP